MRAVDVIFLCLVRTSIAGVREELDVSPVQAMRDVLEIKWLYRMSKMGVPRLSTAKNRKTYRGNFHARYKGR